ncbi:unnamed protein product [Linum tenue]|uniref:Chitin-binding type-1 domain-containing protein n=1 Tax=Linum tenue TaxID=586396 RepID=A0AAV0IFZ2_9ROSI|nr:unnamed protein product [Linum tenue]
MSPPAVIAAVESDNHTCTCRPLTTGCAECGTGRCCSDFGYCGSLVGYCTPCNCAKYDGTTYVCNPCNCLGGCADPDPDPGTDPDPPEPPEPDHDRDDEKMLLIDATYDQNLDNKASSSEYGCAAVCGPPASNVSTTHSNIIAAGQCLLAAMAIHEELVVVDFGSVTVT